MQTLAAFTAADRLLVPVEAYSMALGGLGELMRTVRRRLNIGLELLGVFACWVDPRMLVGREVAAALRQSFRGSVFETAIRERVSLREAWGHHRPITVYDPRGASPFSRIERTLRWEGEPMASARRQAASFRSSPYWRPVRWMPRQRRKPCWGWERELRIASSIWATSVPGRPGTVARYR